MLELPVGDQLVRQEPTRITRLLVLFVEDDPLSLISSMRADGTLLPMALAFTIIVDFQLEARRVTIEKFHRRHEVLIAELVGDVAELRPNFLTQFCALSVSLHLLAHRCLL